MKITTIIVAGGVGRRMQTEIPKQFLLLNGLPVMMQTMLAEGFGEIETRNDDVKEINLTKFVSREPQRETIQNNFVVVIPLPFVDLWRELCVEHKFAVKHKIVSGGQTRSQSVQNGLNEVDDDTEIVMIHDAVRPFVRKEMVEELINNARKFGSAVPVTKVKESVREIVNFDKSSHFATPRLHHNKCAYSEPNNYNSVTVDRDCLRMVQTPQAFRKEIILEAYSKIDPQKIYTDDATVVQEAGFEVVLTKGCYENVKLTTPEDMDYAEWRLGKATPKSMTI